MKAVSRAARAGLRILVLSTVVGLAAGAAQARTAACDGLERQLARAQGAAQGSSGSKWDEAARQQSAAIAAANRDAAYFRCSVQPGSPKCAGLLDKIKRMQANLAKIERQRAKANPGAARGSRDVTRLQAALVRNRCAEAPARVQKTRASDALEAPRPSGLLGRIFGNSDPVDRPVINAAPQPSQQLRASSRASEQIGERRSRVSISDLERPDGEARMRIPAGGTFRTLCVRTCDGYFYPISFSTGPDQFPQDAQTCASMCPAAETELFVYRNPGGEPEDMVSLSGVAYKDLPNAFRHRREYVEGCSCQAKGSASAGLQMPGGANMSLKPVAGLRLPPRATLSDIADESPLTGSLRASANPVQADAIPADTDPDTRQNLSEGFDPTIRIKSASAAGETAELEVRGAPEAAETPAATATDVEAEPAPQPSAPRGPVRQVGPKFFSDR